MKEGRPSFTAELTTAARAAASMRPAGKRVCYDPLAKDFLSLPFRIMARSRFMLSAAVWIFERLAPGVPGEVIGRTKYIDDCLQARIDDGIKQLVILGAGYDTRPYRFGALRDRVKVFEVDHPATQRVKIERVRRVLGHLPDHVIFVPVDFEVDRLDQKLFDSGYQRDLKTFFIWEGVTFYLTARAVENTLAFVAANSGEGSSIVFDYAFQSVIEGTSDFAQINRALKAWERIGAPLTAEHFMFGVKEGTIEDFLRARGFCRIDNVNGDSFQGAYFRGVDQSDNIARICGFVHAAVATGSVAGTARSVPDRTGTPVTSQFDGVQF